VHFKNFYKNFEKNANLVVKGLAQSVTSRQLMDECEKYGKVCSCVVRKVEEEGRMKSLGYAYVQFESIPDAENFMQTFSGNEICGEVVTVERFKPYKDRENDLLKKSSNLYIKNFPEDFGEPEIESFLEQMAAEVGEITSKGVFKDEKRGKFYAFVAFKELECA